MKKGERALFGYVKACKPEMKVKHYEAYKGVYCSVCRTLGKRYGLIARLTLSYDFTFLAIVRMCIGSEVPDFQQKRCPFNPSKKCNFCRNGSSALDYTADAAMLMVYYKIIDDIADSGILKKLLLMMIKPVFYRYYKKAKGYQPELDGLIGEMMNRQASLEKAQTADIDEAAEPTALALGEIFCYNCGDEAQGKVLRRMGYCLGRWVYLADALDDMEKDREKGNYNPLILSGKTKDDVICTLNLTESEIANAYELLEVRHFRSVIENVVYEGLHAEAERIYNA